MKKLSLLLSALLLSTYAYAAKPNVLFIYVDDMGYGDMSWGNKEAQIQTPHLDLLADSGMTLTDAHSSSGLCSSSRYAVLTGKYHWRRFHGIVFPFDNSVFKPNEFTIARMFKAQGYKTACIGKWHLGWDWKALEKEGFKPQVYPPKPKNSARDHYSRYIVSDLDWAKRIPDGPVDQGFDYYFGDDVICFPPYAWIENDKFVTAPDKMVKEDFLSVSAGEEGNYRGGPTNDDWNVLEVLPTITKKAVEYISAQNADEPFFLYLPLPSPHAPVVPTSEFIGKSNAGAYGDFVVQTDDAVGQVLAALEAKGLRDNTLIVFSSDNGACEYTYDRQKQTGHWSSGDFRGIKRDIYEGGHHVPFIVSWKGKVEAGAVRNDLVSQVDLAATFAEIIGYDLAKNEALDSYNILPVFEGAKLESPIRTETIHNTMAGKYALRQGDWVYMNTKSGYSGFAKNGKTVYIPNNQKPKNENTPALLYNLREDIAQVNNLYKKQPERVKAMKTQLNAIVNSKATAPHTK